MLDAHVALVLPDGPAGEAERLADALSRALRGTGRAASVLAAGPGTCAPFPGHPGAPGAPRPLEEAVRTRARFDVVVGFGWRAFYAMFRLDAPSYVHVVVEPRSAPEDASEAALAELARGSGAAALVAGTPARRAALVRAHAREAVLLPAFADLSDGRAARFGSPFRVLVAGPEGAATALASEIARGARVEAWATVGPPTGGLDGVRRVVPPPPAAFPPLLRSCDAVVVTDALVASDLPPLEAMAAGAVVVAEEGPEWAHLLRPGGNAWTSRGGESLVAALERVARDPDLRERLRAGGRTAASARAGERAEREAVDALLRAAGEIRAPSAEERREFARVAASLVPAARAGPPRRRGTPLGRASKAVSRAIGAVFSLGRGAGERPVPRPASDSDAAGVAEDEPIVFVGQRTYFRSAWADAVGAGWGIEHPVRVGDRRAIEALPALVDSRRARTCVVLDPWLLASAPEVLASLRGSGVRLVAWSTEPVPHTDAPRVHWDAVRRLDDLRRSRDAGFHLWIHHDPSSEGFLRAEGFTPLRIHPLPVSESLFFPEDVPRDIDACFLGWSTPHREAFLAPIEARFRTLHVAHGAFDEEARRIMNRSKVVLNLHVHDAPNFENRCVQALFCGRPLVSEPLSGGYLEPEADYLLARTPDEMAGRVRDVVKGRAGPPARFDRSRFLASSLRALLSEPTADAAPR